MFASEEGLHYLHCYLKMGCFLRLSRSSTTYDFPESSRMRYGCSIIPLLNFDIHFAWSSSCLSK